MFIGQVSKRRQNLAKYVSASSRLTKSVGAELIYEPMRESPDHGK